MKRYLLPGALAICLIWATSSTWLYWDLYTKSEQFLNQGAVLSQESALLLETQELTDFTKNFLERNFTYTNKNFTQVRHSQAKFLSSDLRSSYLEETERVAERLKDRSLDYSAKLIELVFSTDQSFTAITEVNLKNENRKVFFQSTGNLIRSTRTLENTAGLLFGKFTTSEFTPQNTSPTSVPLILYRPLALHFPCKVEDFESPLQSELHSQVKVQPHSSEMQIVLKGTLPEDTPLKIRCRDFFYDLVLKSNEQEYLAYKDFHLKDGVKIIRNKKDSYDLLIDKVLGNSRR